MGGYDGHVEPGGPSITRTVKVDGAEVEVRKLSVGRMDNNVYALRDVQRDELLLVDAADQPERILEEIGDTGVAAVVTTHGHRDHWQALAAVTRATGAPTFVHPADREMISVDVDRDLRHGDELHFGDTAVQILHTPGHTPGSVCLLLGRHHLFTGDTLFPGGPGRVRTPVEFETIMDSLRLRLFALDDETWVYPGHGDDTTIGAERPQLDEWQARGW